MPDISMCDNKTCPLMARCYRHEASGTYPTPLWQSWMEFDWRATKQGPQCDDYWPNDRQQKQRRTK